MQFVHRAMAVPILIVLNVIMSCLCVSDIPANMNVEDLQALLQTNIPGMGVVNVEHTGDCTGRKWTITWLTVPGELPLIEVSDLTISICDSLTCLTRRLYLVLCFDCKMQFEHISLLTDELHSQSCCYWMSVG